MSLIDTAGRSGRFRTRAQNRAITIESAPRSSKKLLSTDTRSTCMTSASTSAKALSVLDSEHVRMPCVVGESARPAVKEPRASCTMSGGPRNGGQLIGAEHVLAVQILHPVGLVDRVEIALAEVRGDSHRGLVVRVMHGSTSPSHR